METSPEVEGLAQTAEETQIDDSKQEQPQDQGDDYSQMERNEVPAFEKQRGTEAFKRGEYFQAAKHYSKSLMAFNYLIKDGVIKDEAEAKKMQQEIVLPVNLNIAMCHIKLKDYRSAKQFCDLALQIDPKNVKGLYRRGKSNLELGDFKSAKLDFKSVLEQDPDNEDAKISLQIVEDRVRRQKEKEKLMHEKMMSGLDYSDDPTKYKPLKTEDQKGYYELFKDSLFNLKQALLCRKRKTKNN